MNKNASLFTVKQILFIVLFLESLAVVLAITLALAADLPPKAYFGEVDDSGYITYVSFFQLCLAAVWSWKIFKTLKSSQRFSKGSFFWLIICLGLFFLALDDVIGIHEELDSWMHDLFRLEETELSDLADDLIVGGYLIISVIYVATKWQTVKIFQQSFSWFKLGFALTLVMIVLDLLSNNMLFISMVTDNEVLMLDLQQWFGVVEDSAKIFAEGMFLVGIYKCWQIAKTLDSQHS